MGAAFGFNNVTNSICGNPCDSSPPPPQHTFVDIGQLNAIIAGQKSTARAVNSDFTYLYSRQRTQQNLRGFAARAPDPASRAALEQMIAAEPTLMESLAVSLGSFRLDLHDVSDVYAM